MMSRKTITRKIKQNDKLYLLKLIHKYGREKNGNLVMSFEELTNYFYLERNYGYTQFPTLLELCGELEKEGMLRMVF